MSNKNRGMRKFGEGKLKRILGVELHSLGVAEFYSANVESSFRATPVLSRGRPGIQSLSVPGWGTLDRIKLDSCFHRNDDHRSIYDYERKRQLGEGSFEC